MIKKVMMTALLTATMVVSIQAQDSDNYNVDATTGATEQKHDKVLSDKEKKEKRINKFMNAVSRLHIGGYAEVVMSRMFYSDHPNRYSDPSTYKDYPDHGRFDIPHVCLNIGYDFGKGWSFGSEIEFEHGGTESAVEMDADETGEYEAETEKGGEVALEQAWINKEFWKGIFNVKAGEIIVPVGLTNAHHEPLEFFTCYRNEGENTLFPCTWHQVGVSLWGRYKWLRYEAEFLSGLNSDQFGSESFIHYGANSPYEFKVANSYAGALRLDFYVVKGLRLGLSGYYGTSFINALNRSTAAKYDNVKGAVAIGAFDFSYEGGGLIARGNIDYSHLSDADMITAYNKNYASHTQQDGSPSKHQVVGSNAFASGIEVGYNIFYPMHKAKLKKQALIPFVHYEYYNSMAAGTYSNIYEWCGKHRLALGLNYKPIKQIVIKAEWSKRFYKQQYNDEPSISLGIAYQGFFL